MFSMLFSGLFFGVLLVIIGVLVVFKAIFRLTFPIAKIVFALIFIYIGIAIISGFDENDKPRKFVKYDYNINYERNYERNMNSSTIIFSSADTSYQKGITSYSCVFGSATIDLRNIDISESSVHIDIDTVFGSTRVKLDPDKPYRIRGEVAFGTIEYPDRNSISFGNRSFSSESLKDSGTYIDIKANTVFGRTDFY